VVVTVKDANIRIEKLELGPFGTNAYIVVCQQTGDSVLIDTPADAGTIMKRLEGTNPRYILMTHNHMDHLGAFSELRSKLKVPVAAHLADINGLLSSAEILLDDGDTVSFGDIKLEVLHTPGHTPGSLCFRAGHYLISGDTIFPGGPGKTRTPTDLRQIIESITGKIIILSGDTQIYPGHGDSTTLKKEKDEFAIFSSRPHDPNLCGDILWLSA
jgi:glyoxylase-like metal-dependent hydrolase (beta-lactamase superfamily II)